MTTGIFAGKLVKWKFSWTKLLQIKWTGTYTKKSVKNNVPGYACDSGFIENIYLDPATRVFPDEFTTIWLTGAVNLVRIPSGAPSGNVWACIVFVSVDVKNLAF